MDNTNRIGENVAIRCSRVFRSPSSNCAFIHSYSSVGWHTCPGLARQSGNIGGGGRGIKRGEGLLLANLSHNFGGADG